MDRHVRCYTVCCFVRWMEIAEGTDRWLIDRLIVREVRQLEG